MPGRGRKGNQGQSGDGQEGQGRGGRGRGRGRERRGKAKAEPNKDQPEPGPGAQPESPSGPRIPPAPRGPAHGTVPSPPAVRSESPRISTSPGIQNASGEKKPVSPTREEPRPISPGESEGMGNEGGTKFSPVARTLKASPKLPGTPPKKPPTPEESCCGSGRCRSSELDQPDAGQCPPATLPSPPATPPMRAVSPQSFQSIARSSEETAESDRDELEEACTNTCCDTESNSKEKNPDGKEDPKQELGCCGGGVKPVCKQEEPAIIEQPPKSQCQTGCCGKSAPQAEPDSKPSQPQPEARSVSDRERAGGTKACRNSTPPKPPPRTPPTASPHENLNAPLPSIRAIRVRVAGLCCEKEVRLVKELTMSVDGCRNTEVNLFGRVAVVQYDENLTTALAIVDKLNSRGLGASLQGGKLSQKPPKEALIEPMRLCYLVIILLLCLVTGLWPLFMPKTASSPSKEAPSVDSSGEYGWIQFSLVLAMLILALPPIVRSAATALMDRHTLDMNGLVLLPVIGCLYLGQYSDCVLLVGCFTLSREIERMSGKHIQNELSDLDIENSAVAVTPKGEVVEVDEIQSGTILAARAGDRVAVDGLILKGAATVDESAVTGESTPLEKSAGDELPAAALIQNGYIEYQATTDVNGSSLFALQQLVATSQAKGTQVGRMIDSIATYYTPLVVVAALLLAVMGSMLLVGGPSLWIQRSMVLLILSCPCSLVMATPSVIVCCIASCVRSGVVIKNPDAVTEMGRVRCIGMDKTGTLTEGKLQVTDFNLAKEKSCQNGPGQNSMEEELNDYRFLAKLAGAVERRSTHPIASAIVQYALQTQGGNEKEHEGCLAEAMTLGGLVIHGDGAEKWKGGAMAVMDVGGVFPNAHNLTTIPGRGVKALVEHPSGDGREFMVAVGNIPYMQDLGAFGDKPGTGDYKPEWEALQRNGKTVAFIAVDGKVKGFVALMDSVREDTPHTLNRLKDMGIMTSMITGDTQEVALGLQRMLNIYACRASQTPQQKVQWVQEKQAQGRVVCMVGDGLNDAAALARANVGIAMGATGTDMAAEASDVLLIQDNLGLLPAMFRRARSAKRSVMFNIAFSFFIKAVAIVCAVIWGMPLWVAVLLDICSLLFVTFNGMRFLRPLGMTQSEYKDRQMTFRPSSRTSPLMESASLSTSYGTSLDVV